MEGSANEGSWVRRTLNKFSPAEAIIVLILIFVLGGMAITIYSSIQEGGADGDSSSGVVESSGEIRSEAAPAEPAEPIDWNPLILGLGGVLGVAALGGGVVATTVGISSIRRSRRETRSEKIKARSIRDSAIKRHQDVLVRYSSYETDLWKALNYPALHDVEVETTNQFLKSMRDAEAKKKSMEADEEMLSEDLYTIYEKAVSQLEQTFTVAENKAIRLGESNLSFDEQKDIRTARNLLNQAEDSGNNEQLRANYYAQLKRVIVRLNEAHGTPVIPQPAFTEIEHRSRRLLTDGDASINSGILMGDGAEFVLNDNTAIFTGGTTTGRDPHTRIR